MISFVSPCMGTIPLLLSKLNNNGSTVRTVTLTSRGNKQMKGSCGLFTPHPDLTCIFLWILSKWLSAIQLSILKPSRACMPAFLLLPTLIPSRLHLLCWFPIADLDYSMTACSYSLIPIADLGCLMMSFPPWHLSPDPDHCPIICGRAFYLPILVLGHIG